MRGVCSSGVAGQLIEVMGAHLVVDSLRVGWVAGRCRR